MISGNDVVRVQRAVLEALVAEARRAPQLECCGLLAGRDGLISAIFPARNLLQSATAFEIEPAELFALFRRLRAEKLDDLGIYHSHPSGVNSPSGRDIERAFYPAAAYFIISPQTDAPHPVRAFRICGAEVRELEIQPVEA